MFSQSSSKINNNYLGISDYLWIALFLFIGFFFQYGNYAIDNINEGLYAQIAREMLNTHNSIIPYLNGVPYLEKPPLLYWLVAFSYRLFGVSAWSARLIPVLAATATALSLFIFGKTQKEARSGWLSTIILSSSAGFILVARVLIFDMLLTFFLTIALLLFYRWYQTHNRYLLRAAYIALACGFLTKGLIAVILAGLICLIFMLVNKTSLKKISQLFDPPGILIFLAISLPWIIFTSLQINNFFWDFFINEQLMRFFNKRIPDDYHSGPIYYYIPRLIIYLLPWSVSWPFLIKKSQQPENNGLEKFLWCWIAIPFLFFSLAGDKGDYYLIIIAPALAYLLGNKINFYFIHSNAKPLNYCLAVLVFLEIISVWLIYGASYTNSFTTIISADQLLPADLRWLTLTIVLIISVYGLSAVIVAFNNKNKPKLAFLLLAGLIAPLLYFYVATKNYFEKDHSMMQFANYIKQHSNSDRKIFLYRSYENISSIRFYLDKRLPIIDSESDDLLYGSHTDKARGWFLTSKDLSEICGKNSCYVISPKNRLGLFYQTVKGIKFCIVFENSRNVLFSNSSENCLSQSTVRLN